MPLHVSSTMCLSSGGENCIIQHLVSSHSVGGRPVHIPFSTCAPDGHLQVWWYQMLYNTVLTSWWWTQQCSKHVQAYNKVIIKQDFCALSWLITKINCTPFISPWAYEDREIIENFGIIIIIISLTRRKVSKFQICNAQTFTPRVATLQNHLQFPSYKGADKSLARPRRKQANVSVRMAWISFSALPCRKKKTLMTARVSMLMKSRAFLSCFRAWVLPGRAKDLSAPRVLFLSLNNLENIE